MYDASLAPTSHHDALDAPGAALLAALDPFLGVRRARRVHVISGSYGAGHDAAAREIGRRLEAAGHHVEQWDVASMFPLRLGLLARSIYLWQLELAPTSWAAVLEHLHPGTRSHRTACGAMQLARRRVERLAANGADLFVATHPFASQVLGELRASGRLTTPTATYLTDPSVHPLWVHPAVDVHLALHEVAADQARLLGGRSRVVRPLLPDAYRPERRLSPAAATRLRHTLGLGSHQQMALVVGGSRGIGELLESARDIQQSRLAVPVVACGTNTRLRSRISALPGVVSLGWRDDLPDLIQAADCVVQNAGGFTSWESLAAGTPVLTYRPIPGHGTTNAAALDRAGLVPWATDVEELRHELGQALEQVPELVGS